MKHTIYILSLLCGISVTLHVFKILYFIWYFNFFNCFKIILNVFPEKGLEKELDADRFAEKGIGYHIKVNNGYLEIAKQYPEISAVVDYKEGDIEGMQQEIRVHVEQRLKI